MALWNTFKWSDGTKWADANGIGRAYTSFIDRSGYYVSLKLSHTNNASPGSLFSFIIQSLSAELGIRPQLPSNFEAFIDRNETTQRIAAKVHFTSGATTELATESGEIITTEGGDPIALDTIDPFIIEKIHMLVNRRSRRQPTA